MSKIVIEFIADHSGQDSIDQDARDLQQFLNQDDELRGLVANRISPARPGEQGGIADAVELAKDLGPLLIQPLTIWLTARLSKGKVALKLHRPDGTELELSADDVADTGELLAQVQNFLAE